MLVLFRVVIFKLSVEDFIFHCSGQCHASWSKNGHIDETNIPSDCICPSKGLFWSTAGAERRSAGSLTKLHWDPQQAEIDHGLGVPGAQLKFISIGEIASQPLASSLVRRFGRVARLEMLTVSAAARASGWLAAVHYLVSSKHSCYLVLS